MVAHLGRCLASDGTTEVGDVATFQRVEWRDTTLRPIYDAARAVLQVDPPGHPTQAEHDQ